MCFLKVSVDLEIGLGDDSLGVRVGPGTRMPNLPALYRPKRKWRLPDQSAPWSIESRQDADGAWSSNDSSVAEMSDNVVAVLEDHTERGQILKLTTSGHDSLSELKSRIVQSDPREQTQRDNHSTSTLRWYPWDLMLHSPWTSNATAGEVSDWRIYVWVDSSCERGSQASSGLALAGMSGSEWVRCLCTYSWNVRCSVSVLLLVACRWRHRTSLATFHWQSCWNLNVKSTVSCTQDKTVKLRVDFFLISTEKHSQADTRKPRKSTFTIHLVHPEI